MNRSEQINELAAALAKAQAEMRFASKANVNPHFKSKYADLASVIEAIRDPLSRNGLSHTQLCREGENGAVTVDTMLMHASGQFIASTMTMRPQKNDPQGVGSALTYARRYALQGICGLASDDDDGNAASGQHAAGNGNGHAAPARSPADNVAPFIKRLADAKTPEELIAIGGECRKQYDKGTPEMKVFMVAFREAEARMDKAE